MFRGGPRRSRSASPGPVAGAGVTTARRRVRPPTAPAARTPYRRRPSKLGSGTRPSRLPSESTLPARALTRVPGPRSSRPPGRPTTRARIPVPSCLSWGVEPARSRGRHSGWGRTIRPGASPVGRSIVASMRDATCRVGWSRASASSRDSSSARARSRSGPGQIRRSHPPGGPLAIGIGSTSKNRSSWSGSISSTGSDPRTADLSPLRVELSSW
jgi:hypothetical protein